MRYIIYAAVLCLLSCGQNSNKQKTDAVTTDSSGHSLVTVVQKDSTAVEINADESAVNQSLQNSYKNKWVVLNDKSAKWMKDAFDYFIVPKRKEDPNYPYIAKGDFNGDGKMDTAAVVTDSLKKNYRIAILLGNEIKFWEEDILEDAAINTLPKPGEIKGMADGNIEKLKIVKTKGDAIEVNYFEKASFVLYYDKKVFKRIQTSD